MYKTFVTLTSFYLKRKQWILSLTIISQDSIKRSKSSLFFIGTFYRDFIGNSSHLPSIPKCSYEWGCVMMQCIIRGEIPITDNTNSRLWVRSLLPLKSALLWKMPLSISLYMKGKWGIWGSPKKHVLEVLLKEALLLPLVFLYSVPVPKRPHSLAKETPILWARLERFSTSIH